jgi:hypothetical protein
MKSSSVTDPYLVIDQKGLRVLVTGLFIAVIIGMTFRAIYSPGRIKYLIEKIVEDSNVQNATIKIDKAFLSLSRGWIPRLAVVIDGLELQSMDPCLYYINVKSDVLTLPVSLQSIFERSLIFKKIEIDHPVVKLKTKDIKCADSLFSSAAAGKNLLNTQVDQSASEATKFLPKPIDSQGVVEKNSESPIVENFRDGAVAQLVKTLSIELTNGELHFDNFPDFYIKEKKLQIEFLNPTEKRILVDGEIELEPVTDDRLTGWKFRVQMESIKDLVTTHLKGHWREGSVKLDLNYQTSTNELEAVGDFKQVPLGQILIFTNELGWTKMTSSARQSWISFNSKYQKKGNLDRNLIINNVKVEGEFGDIEIPIIEAQGSPFSWKPLSVSLNSLNLSKLLKSFDRPHPSPSLSSLGIFRGFVEIEGTHLKSAEGTLQGLELVFSNKGIRELQAVSNLDLQITDIETQYKGKISNIELSQGTFAGVVEAYFNKSDESTQVNFNIEQLKLNPRVEKLMTSKGALSPIQGKLSFHLQREKKPEVNGILKLDTGIIDNVSFEKFKWELNTLNQEDIWKFSVQDLKWNEETPSLLLLQEILKTDKTDLEMKNLFFKAKKTLSQGLVWSDLQVQVINPKSRLSSQGAWDEDGNISGTLQIKTEKEMRDLNLQGTRESPEWH